jgi:hypothetical protein
MYTYIFGQENNNIDIGGGKISLLKIFFQVEFQVSI